MTTQQFYYLITDLLGSVETESLYVESGKDEKYDKMSIGKDNLKYVGTLLKKSCSEVFKMLHKLSYGLETPYEYSVEITDIEGLYVSYTITLPTKFDTNLIIEVDNQIENCIVAKTLYKWFKKKGRMTKEIEEDRKTAETKLRNIINYRTEVTKTYRPY